MVFQSEVDAYEIAMKNEELSKLVPHFYGPVLIGRLEGAREEVAHDKAYSMEFIEGDFRKIGTVNSSEKMRIVKLFRKHGINHVIDSSVIMNEENQIIKVVDFATKEFELLHED